GGPSLQSEACPENAARERTRVRTLRQAFLALQAALPAVPPDTKLSKLDVLVLATSYIAHLTRMLGHELPGPAWPPFLRGLRYLHPLKVGCWPRVLVGNLGEGNGIGIIFFLFSREEDRGWLLGWSGDWVLSAWECDCFRRKGNSLRFLVSGEERSGFLV
ncbi:Transcription factor 23, partial [Lemmus lemmus]